MKGFTFIELLISISIMLLLLLLSFPFYTSINKQLTIDRAATRLVQDIRKAQELAMSAQEHYDPDLGYIIPSGGYGIAMLDWDAGDPYHYVIFADYTGKNLRYDVGGGAYEKVEIVELEKGVSITNIDNAIKHILFLAPDPNVFFSKAAGQEVLPSTTNEAVITLSNGTDNVIIHINRAGLVYIE